MPSDDEAAGLVSPGTEVDDSSASGGSPPDTSTPASGGFNTWSKNKKMAVLGGGGIAVGLVFYLLTKKKASTSTTASSGTTPTLVLPSSNQDAQMSSAYAGLSNQLSQLLAQQQPGNPVAAPTPTGAPTPVLGGPGNIMQPGPIPPSAIQDTHNSSTPFNAQPYTGASVSTAPIGSITGYTDMGNLNIAEVAQGGGLGQGYNTATGAAYGNPYYNPSLPGAFVPAAGGGAPIATATSPGISVANAAQAASWQPTAVKGVYKPGQVPVYNSATSSWGFLTQTPNAGINA
jgi:hypothetical protein